MSGTIFEWFAKPEYLWRPHQLLRRLNHKARQSEELIPLPWKVGIYARSGELIGRALATQGVYDLPVTEALTRLLEPGETAVDVGANIGYMSFVLARAVGPTGRVIAFEPNPRVLSLLKKNLALWRTLPIGLIELQEMALSDHEGNERLGLPETMSENEGTATLEPGSSTSVPVTVGRLDDMNIDRIGVMKVDVEGHETSVFAGSDTLLSEKRIRDIVFEEHQPYPAASHKLLRDHGYRVYRLTRSAFRPLLIEPHLQARQRYLPANFLGTCDPVRAERRLAPWGWRAL